MSPIDGGMSQSCLKLYLDGLNEHYQYAIQDNREPCLHLLGALSAFLVDLPFETLTIAYWSDTEFNNHQTHNRMN